jgi:hypothetical protein
MPNKAIIRTAFGVAVVSLLLLILGTIFSNHLWWKTSRFAVTDNGQPVRNAETFEKQTMLYVQLPNRRFEAYVIDTANRSVVHNQPHRFASMGYVLISEDMPPVGAGFGKLEREPPRFEGNAVKFSADDGEQISVSW